MTFRQSPKRTTDTNDAGTGTNPGTNGRPIAWLRFVAYSSLTSDDVNLPFNNISR